MINVTEQAKEQGIFPLFRLGFRPFFLFGSLFSLIAMLIWILTLSGKLSISPVNGIVWWHSHEMLYGFVTAIIAGFLLTAVQNWTGIAGIKGKRLFFLFITWLIARILILNNFGIPLIVVMCVDLAFLPMVAYFLGKPVIKIKQFRNLIFVPILLLMTLTNAFTYLPAFDYPVEYSQKAMHTMVMLITFIVALIGGRVIPMFTANGTQTKKVTPRRFIEIPALAFLLFIAISLILDSHQSFLGALCAVACLLHIYRSVYWRPWVTFNVPLVWCLHLSMFFIPLGLGLLAIHFLFQSVSLSVGIHSLTVGVIGGMIIAMITRVSLGHTGRPLKPSPIMIIAFVAIALAALVRGVLVSLLPELIQTWWLVSGILWCIAFSCFVLVYTPILFKPRLDGKPG